MEKNEPIPFDLHQDLLSQSHRKRKLGTFATIAAHCEAAKKKQGILGRFSSTYNTSINGVNMKVDPKIFYEAIRHLKYAVPEEAELEIIVKEEDVNKDNLCDHVVVIASYEEEPSSYDSNRNPENVQVILEIFAKNEAREPRILISKSRNLAIK